MEDMEMEKRWHLLCLRCGAKYSYSAEAFAELSYRKRSYCDRCIDEAVHAMNAGDQKTKTEPAAEWTPVATDAPDDRIRKLHEAIDCRRGGHDKCKVRDCPYTPYECEKQIISDVRIMVSGKIPRLYRYDELFGEFHPETIFLENPQERETISRGKFQGGGYVFQDGTVLTQLKARRDFYNRTYRCWSEYPSKARRLREPWAR